MLRRSLPFLALLIIGLAMTWRWTFPSPSEGNGAPPSGSGDPGLEAQKESGPSGIEREPQLPTDPGPRRLVQRDLQASVIGEDGRLVWGTAYWLELNPELIQALESKLTLASTELRELGRLQQARFDDGKLAVALPSEHDYFFWIEAPGHHPAHWFLDREEFPERIALEPCAPFEVQILDQDDGGVMAASIVITREGADPNYLDLDWRQRLTRRYFQQSSSPNSQGLAVFDILPKSRLFVWVKPRGPFGVQTRDHHPAVGRLVLRLESAATLYGRVTDPEGQGIEGVFIAAMVKDDRGVRTSVGDTVTDADGRYRNEQVTVTGEGLMAIAFLDGFESQTAPLPFLRAGKEYQVDFQLQEGKARQIRVQSPEGEALTGLRLEFAHTPYDWVPFAATVDEAGLASVKPILIDDQEYCVNVFSAGTRVYQGILRTSSAEEVQVFTIPGLGRFDGPMPHAPGERYLEITPRGVGTRTFSVESHEACPWVPAGPAQLQIVDRAGVGSEIQSVTVLPGTQAWPTFDRELPRVAFELALEEEEEVQVVVSGAGYSEQRLGTVTQGVNLWSIPAPGLEFRLVSSKRGKWSLGALCADGQDLDLGKLVWPQEGELLVTAIGPDGVGMPRTAIQVFSQEGAWLLDARTGPYGRWLTQALRTGAFLVRVSPSDGHGAPLPPQEYSVLVRAGQQTEIRAVFDDPSGFTLVPVAAPPHSSWFGEVRVGSTATRTRANARGELEFGASEAYGDWCAWSAMPGQLLALGASGVPIQGRQEFSPPSTVQLGLDTKHAGAIQLCFGSRLISTAAVGPDGSCRLQLSLPSGYFLRWVDAEGEGPRTAVETVLASGELPLRSRHAAPGMRVIDELGRLLPGSIALFLEGAESKLADSEGIIRIDAHLLGSTVRVERSGYHPVEQITEADQDLVLRRLAGPLVIGSTLAANRVRIVPLFPLSVPLTHDVREGGAVQRAEFDRIPAGDYRVEWLDSLGEVVNETIVQLSFGGAVEVDPL